MTETTKTSASVWAGRVLSTLVVLFLLMDAGMKLAVLQPVIDTTGALGWPTEPDFLRGLGLVLLIATLLYAFPQTSVLGAIFLTGYLGGAVATHVRVGSPLFSHVLFGVYIGVMMWGGLYLRDPRIRVLLPLRA
jgi:hypothetical protein